MRKKDRTNDKICNRLIDEESGRYDRINGNHMEKVFENSQWIWCEKSDFLENTYVAFERDFIYESGDCRLKITADCVYHLYVNGTYVGCGPARAYPEHYLYDEYDLLPYIGCGKNEIRVRVIHFGVSTFHHVLTAGGLLAELTIEGKIIGTDGSWRCAKELAYATNVPKISCQQQYEEQYDARKELSSSDWRPAIGLRPAEDGIHRDLKPRPVPYFSDDLLRPVRYLGAFKALKNEYIAFDIGFLLPKERFGNTPYLLDAGFCAIVDCDKEAEATVLYRELWNGLTVNGKAAGGTFNLRKGENIFFFCECGIRHATQAILSVRTEAHLKIKNVYMAGPFDPVSSDGTYIKDNIGHYLLIDGASAFQKQAAISALAAGKYGGEYIRKITHALVKRSVFAETYRAVGEQIKTPFSFTDFLSERPQPIGCGDVAMLFDFGRECIGNIEIKCIARAGTVVEFHGFEFIQPDGRRNYSEGMSNTMRYVCKDGVQSYRSVVRRGFRFAFLTVRGDAKRFSLLSFAVHHTARPDARRGDFFCSDYLLNSMYEHARETIRCCTEDTYTDCPTYEQTFWVGDMRNEALEDYVMSGETSVWKRCLLLAGQSLEFAPLTLSQVPSGWWNVLPAWSFLWMISAREYLLYTGDEAGAREVLPMLVKNTEGIAQHMEADGLFVMEGWNLFDWAPMDIPPDGAVTHVNCFAVWALKETAQLAHDLGETSFSERCTELSERISDAVNRYLWSEERQAYVDCARGSRRTKSAVFSQQTQTVALLSGVAQGERRRACEAKTSDPQDFVTSGSPFYTFFLLSVLAENDREEEFFTCLRKNWRMMLDTGCTVFWEQWGYPSPDGRLTRSHCHGWSAAPSYFLAQYVLGVKPLRKAEVSIRPHLGDLTFARGTVPVPGGEITLSVRRENGKYWIRYEAPPSTSVRLGENVVLEQ